MPFRSEIASAAVAATRSGYTNSFNVLEGFEGDKDAVGHRNSVGLAIRRPSLDPGVGASLQATPVDTLPAATEPHPTWHQ